MGMGNEKQETLALALELATKINDDCETQEEVDEVFRVLSEILKPRFTLDLCVA